MEVNLSKEFPTISPLTLRKEKARDVFLLVRRNNRYLRNEAKEKTGKKKIIRRPAGDDWF